MSDTQDGDETASGTSDGDVVTTAQGAGGEQMRSLVDDLVVSRFAPDDETGDGDSTAVGLQALDDGAVLPTPDIGGDGSVVVTTDSHVVKPLEFPGGDIGRLAVSGTVNDLAVMGATEPLALTCALVVEEGTDRAVLDRVTASLKAACSEAGVEVVTGDTKVLPSGDLDKLAVNTTGVGVVPAGEHVTDDGLRPGDKIVVSSTVGDHGIALLSEREGFDIAGDLESDVAPLNGLVAAAMDAGRVTAMKDPTRGGFATAVTEMVAKADVGATIRHRDVPVSDGVSAAGELLGIDPMDVANEGVVVFGVAPEDADDVVAAVRDHPEGGDAAVVGEATDEHVGRVVLDTGLGRRYLTEPEGEQYPRIC